MRNLSDIINECKKARGSEKPDISVTCVLMRSNIREVPQMVRFWRDRKLVGKGNIAVVCAGTSDIPVAEDPEAAGKERVFDAVALDVKIQDLFGDY